MAKARASDVISGAEFRSLTVDETNFNDTIDTGDTIPAGTTREVMSFELSEDGEMAVYDYLQFGEPTDSNNGESAKGKLFARFVNPSGNELPPSLSFRVVSHPRNDDETTAHTGWIRHRNANESDSAKRLPLPPVTRGGDPLIVQENREIGIEVRCSASDVTVSRSKSEVELPATGGY